MNNKELHFSASNRTNRWDIASEYIYFNITGRYKDIDFSQYKEVLPNGDEVITIDNFHRCLLEQDEEYKNYVIEEVLYDIDRYGYYANKDIEEAISVASNLVFDEFTPDTLGEEEWCAISYLSEKQLEKMQDKSRKDRRNKKIYKR